MQELPAWTLVVVFVLAFAKWLGVLPWVGRVLSSAVSAALGHPKDPADYRFIALKDTFLDAQLVTVERANRRVQWSDNAYVDLEATVRVESSYDFQSIGSQRSLFWIKRALAPPKSRVYVARNLIAAIDRTEHRTSLVLGDPGTGKSVSLRHLYGILATRARNQSRSKVVIPILVDLKYLTLSPTRMTVAAFGAWLRTSLTNGADRLIEDFLDQQFESLRINGQLFFLFDSFDEIPAVIDAGTSGANTIDIYSEVIESYIISSGKCRGVVASRPYRSPSARFVGQRLVIRPLSPQRIREAIARSMPSAAGDRLWAQLLPSQQWAALANNPFYLSLMIDYAAAQLGSNSEFPSSDQPSSVLLPPNKFALLQQFVARRSQQDAVFLQRFHTTPAALLEFASEAAFAMTGGVKPATSMDSRLLTSGMPSRPSRSRAMTMFRALAYCRLGTLRTDEEGGVREFEFAHRRFQEYFAATYMLAHNDDVPTERIVEDDRWREILVLICQVQAEVELEPFIDALGMAINFGIGEPARTLSHRRALEALSVLRDGFRARLDALSDSFRATVGKLILEQFSVGTLLDRKRCVESVIVASDALTNIVVERAFLENSAWLSEYTVLACNYVSTPTPTISRSVSSFFMSAFASFALLLDLDKFLAMASSAAWLRPEVRRLRMMYFWSLLFLCNFIALSLVWLVSESFRFIVLGALVIFAFVICNWLNVTRFWKPRSVGVGSGDFIAKRHQEVSIAARVFPIVLRDSRFDVLWHGYLTLAVASMFVLSVHRSALAVITLIVTVVVVVVSNLLTNEARRLRWTVFGLSARWTVVWLVMFVVETLLIFTGVGSTVVDWLGSVSPVSFGIPSPILSFARAGGTWRGVVLVVATAAAIGFVGFRWCVFAVVDERRLVGMRLSSSVRPGSTADIRSGLKQFRTTAGRVRFCSALKGWLPTGDTESLLEIAEEARGQVRDRLSELAEMWDSGRLE